MSVSKTCFFCTKKEEWLFGIPESGSLKYENSHMYSHDGFQWRKQCRVCARIARPKSDFCQTHSLRTRKPVARGSSYLACAFFDQLEKELSIKIVHRHYTETGVQGSEFRVPDTPYRADGLVVSTNIVIEVLGDFWHGNTDFFAADCVNPVAHVSFGQLQRETFDRLDRITKAGFIVFYVWESVLGGNQTQNVGSLLVEHIPGPRKSKKERKHTICNRL